MCFTVSILAQSKILKGHVSFISSEHVYVRFENTQGITTGDTLFSEKNGVKSPTLKVNQLSSISCVCVPINKALITIGYEVLANIHLEENKKLIPENSKTATEINEAVIETIHENAIKKSEITKITGRISANSYTVFDKNLSKNPSQRFRYNLNFNAKKIANTNLSVETNMAFSHKIGVNTNFTENMKLYSAALNYDLSKNIRVSLGRKLNTSMANVGAVDGLQVEYSASKISFGAVVGSRPDYLNYSIAPTLFQYGAFIGYKYANDKKFAQTSIAFFNQTNNFITDRRFAYIQHSNSLLPNLDFFGSAEIDLYGKVNGNLSTKFDLTSTYLSLRYRPIQKLSLSLVYDVRKNVYYYETFKNLPDSIFDLETRQGLRFQTNYRPFKFITLGAAAGYRMPTTTTAKSINGNVYITFPRVPLINTQFTADAILLQTPYVNGKMYSGTLSRDFANGKLNTDISYRYIDYQFVSTAIFRQHIAELSLYYRLTKKLFISTNFEATLDSDNNSDGRLFINLTQRF